jgi:hypothetical protein
MRVGEDGIWHDWELAAALMQRADRLSVRILKVKSSEAVAFTVGMIILGRPDEQTVGASAAVLRQYFTGKQIDPTTATIIAWTAARAAQRAPKVAPALAQLVSTLTGTEFDPARITADFGLEIAQWTEDLAAFAIALPEIERQRATRISIRTLLIALQEKIIGGAYEARLDEAVTAREVKERRARSLSRKIFGRFTRALTADGGPWSDPVIQAHWRLAPRTDSHFRHLLLRPNRNFDIHRAASGRKAEAGEQQQEYERWIEPQVESVEGEPEAEELETPVRDSELQVTATLVTIAAVYEGSFCLTKSELCFDGVQVSHEHVFSLEGKASKTVQAKLADLTFVLHRSYLHIDKGVEFFLCDGRSYFFFFSGGERSSILSFLKSLQLPNQPHIQRSSSAKMVVELKLTERWVERQISTYDYLMMLNLLAGRSFNDLSQYPVFPWIIADYESEDLKLEVPQTYRDFTKPIGALNDIRLKKLRRESAEAPDPAGICLYRGHYSTAYYVLHYMIRMEPFTTMHITMQAGRFDHPGRLFASIPRQWGVVTSTSNDYRELIPEFFTLAHFLTNSDNFDLGLPHPDVELPAWAHSPVDFICKHRQALESDHVGHHIRHWIDLVFGQKQSGRAAHEADNLFHPYCYSSCVTKRALSDSEAVATIQNHAGSFGITPRQLFTSAHPSRLPGRVGPRPTAFWHFSVFSAGVLKIESDHQKTYILTEDGVLHHFRRSSAEAEYRVPPSTAVLFPASHTAVIGSPSGDAFHFFHLEASATLTRSFRQQFSGLRALAGGGRRVLAVLSRDGSLTAWRADVPRPLFRVNHHFAPAVDAAASESLGVIASVDESGRVVIVEIWSGAFLRSFALPEGAGKILLIEDGFVVVLTEGLCEGPTKIEIRGLDGELVGSRERIGKVTCWCAIDRIGRPGLVAAAFAGGALEILTVPSAEVMTELKFEEGIRAMNYDTSANLLFVADGANQVRVTALEC